MDMGVFRLGYGLIAIRSWPSTNVASFETSDSARPGRYVIQTAPCSSMCTAFSLAIAAAYTVPLQSAQYWLWLPPTGGDESYLIVPWTWLRSACGLNVTPSMSLAH